MTTLKNRPKTALLVVDVQNGVVGGAHERDSVVANVGSLVDKARREKVPVVWVQHSDEELDHLHVVELPGAMNWAWLEGLVRTLLNKVAGVEGLHSPRWVAKMGAHVILEFSNKLK